MSVYLVTDKKIAETSSKGNQEKWKSGNTWYKLDQFGYEALSETFISKLLQQSNILEDTPFTFVRYKMECIQVHGIERTGCSSTDFLRPGESIVTLSHLLKRSEKVPYQDVLSKMSSDKKRITYLAERTAEITGLDYFPQYLTLLFEIDALFLNDDRHLNNIAVLEKNGKFDYCPIFDNGAALLSNTRVLPMDIDPKALAATVKARPFGISFNRQMGTARKTFGRQLKMPKFTQKKISLELESILPYYAERDQGIIKDRVCESIMKGQRIF